MANVSYQNRERAPLTLEEVEMGREAVARKETCRRLFFTGAIAICLLTFGVLFDLTMKHHKARTNGTAEGGQQTQQQNSPYQQQQQQQVNSEEVYEPKTSVVKALSALNEMTLGSDIKAGCESTVIIIRHCEKLGPSTTDSDGNQHCSYVGHERAHFLPTLFDGPGKWPVPSILYALAPKRSSYLNFREIETIQPLADKYGLPIHSEFSSSKEVSEDYFRKLSKGDMCGKVALVSWRHDMIPALADDLACFDCPSIYQETFDEVWILKYVYNVEETSVWKLKYGLESPSTRRGLHKKGRTKEQIPTWSVYSTITYQNFDPLKFSSDAGDYNGHSSGGNWFKGNSSSGEL